MIRSGAWVRPPLPITPKEHERTLLDSVGRCWLTEDAIVNEVACHPETEQLALVGAIANAALIQKEDEFRAQAALGQDPFVWPIRHEDEHIIRKLGLNYPPSAVIIEHAEFIVEQLSSRATCDEVASGAASAARYFNTIPSLRS